MPATQDSDKTGSPPTPYDQWDRLNGRIAERHMTWAEVSAELIEVIQHIDSLRKVDRIPEGLYRQKGNRFRDTIRMLILARSGMLMPERKVSGRTDAHKVDLAWPKGGPVQVALEAKMIGSPAHIRGEKSYKERPISIDLDKRMKEVKYTAIDLKRWSVPEEILGWTRWRDSTPPRFGVALCMRLGAKERIPRLTKKLDGISEYADAIGVAIYTERSRGRLDWVDQERIGLPSPGDLVDEVVRWARHQPAT